MGFSKQDNITGNVVLVLNLKNLENNALLND